MTPIRRTIADIRRHVAAWRKEGLTIGLVPTMGALHEGHLALADASRALCDRTVATIFVNPLQFGPTEDFDTYPRQEDADVAKLSLHGCDVVFAPAVKEMFPDTSTSIDDFPTVVTVRTLTEGLCGAARPGFFSGMVTEVLKTFLIVLPDVAFFGEKDYQQLQVVRRMVRDLDVPVRIEGVPTVREADGLALSSRNAYLSPAQRRVAPMLHQALVGLARRVAGGSRCQPAVDDAVQALRGAGFDRVDYVAVTDAETLAPLDRVAGPARVLAAAWLGRARLIDNVPLQPTERC